ncbi:MAG: porin, partial [Methylocystis sp.]
MKRIIGHRTLAAATLGAATLLPPGAAMAEDTAAEIRELKAELRATIGEVRALKSELDRYKGRSAQQDRKIDAVAAKASKPATASAQELITKGPIAPTAFPYIVDLSHGFTIATTDRSDYFHVGGRIFVDGGASTQPGRGLSEAANLSQARLQVEGRLRSYWEYKLQYDFVGGSNATTAGAVGGIRDAYLAFIHPALTPPFLPNPIEVQVGNFYLPHGLERSAYSKVNIDFNERALMSDTFGASRHVGAALLTHGNNWFAKAAISSTSVEDASLKPASETAVPVGVGDQANWVSTGGRQYYDITARASWAPIWQEDELLHIGASGRYHRPNDSTAANDDRVLALGSSTASESNVLKENFLGTPDLSCSNVPTGNVGVTADPNGVISSTGAGYVPLFTPQMTQTAIAGHCLKSVLTFGAEIAAAYGPLFFQAEYMGSQYNRDPYAVLRANYVASVTNSYWGPAAKSFYPYPFSPGGASEYFSGFYLYTMWFLTGETKAAAYQVDSNTNGGGFA